MCGIAGFIMMPNMQRNEKTLEVIRKLYTEILVETDERGGHASGLVHFNKNKAPMMYKRGEQAVFMVADNQFNQLINDVDNDTTFIIGHTRYATKGNSSNLLNVHPIATLPIVGVHNGSITNDDALFNRHDVPRQAQVDSEIIFQLLAKFNEPFGIDPDSVREVFKELSGNVAIAFANIHDPETICLVKGNNPLELVYDAELGVIWFNSEASFVFRAYMNYTRWTGEELSFDLKTRIMPSNTGFLIKQDELKPIENMDDIDGLRRFYVPATAVAYGRGVYI